MRERNCIIKVIAMNVVFRVFARTYNAAIAALKEQDRRHNIPTEVARDESLSGSKADQYSPVPIVMGASAPASPACHAASAHCAAVHSH